MRLCSRFIHFFALLSSSAQTANSNDCKNCCSSLPAYRLSSSAHSRSSCCHASSLSAEIPKCFLCKPQTSCQIEKYCCLKSNVLLSSTSCRTFVIYLPNRKNPCFTPYSAYLLRHLSLIVQLNGVVSLNPSIYAVSAFSSWWGSKHFAFSFTTPRCEVSKSTDFKGFLAYYTIKNLS